MSNVGILVALKCALLGNPEGTVGVCYDEYDIGDGPGMSIIFENSEYDGFSKEESEAFLTIIGKIPLFYKFNNVMHLSQDFEKGFFNEAIKEGKRIQDSTDRPI